MKPYIDHIYTVRENVKCLHIVGRPCRKYETWGSQNSLSVMAFFISSAFITYRKL